MNPQTFENYVNLANPIINLAIKLEPAAVKLEEELVQQAQAVYDYLHKSNTTTIVENKVDEK